MTYKSSRKDTATSKRSHGRKLAVGYIRVSTVHQDKSDIGQESQEAAIRKFTDELELELLEIFSETHTGMGAHSFARRQQLHNAMEMAKTHDAVLVVYDWSRLSRNEATFDKIRKLLPGEKRILSIKDGADLERAAHVGRLARAETEGKRIGERTKQGMEKRKAEGATFGNPRIHEVQKLGASGFSCKADELVSRMVDILRKTGVDYTSLTYAEAAVLMNRHGLLTLQGKEWTASRIRTPFKKARAALEREEMEQMRKQVRF